VFSLLTPLPPSGVSFFFYFAEKAWTAACWGGLVAGLTSAGMAPRFNLARTRLQGFLCLGNGWSNLIEGRASAGQGCRARIVAGTRWGPHPVGSNFFLAVGLARRSAAAIIVVHCLGVSRPRLDAAFAAGGWRAKGSPARPGKSHLHIAFHGASRGVVSLAGGHCPFPDWPVMLLFPESRPAWLLITFRGQLVNNGWARASPALGDRACWYSRAWQSARR